MDFRTLWRTFILLWDGEMRMWKMSHSFRFKDNCPFYPMWFSLMGVRSSYPRVFETLVSLLAMGTWCTVKMFTEHCSSYVVRNWISRSVALWTLLIEFVEKVIVEHTQSPRWFCPFRCRCSLTVVDILLFRAEVHIC